MTKNLSASFKEESIRSKRIKRLNEEINSNLNSLEDLVKKLEEKENNAAKGIFRKPEFIELKRSYSLAFYELKRLRGDIPKFKERYKSLIERSEELFSLYISYCKSRINPIKRRIPNYDSHNRKEIERLGIRIIPAQDFFANIRNSYSDSKY